MSDPGILPSPVRILLLWSVWYTIPAVSDETTDDTETTPDTTPETELEPELGAVRVDSSTTPPRTLRYVRVIAGQGIWAYWLLPQTAVWNENCVISDTLCNPHAAHFAGRFDEPVVYPRPDSPDSTFIEKRFEYPQRWVVTSGWIPPQPERKLYVEDEDAGLPRFERRD